MGTKTPNRLAYWQNKNLSIEKPQTFKPNYPETNVVSMTYDKKSIFYFSPQERIDLIISWVTLSVAFALVISPIFLQISSLLVSLPIAFVAVGTGFIFHELAHREAAKHFGFHSEFRAWYPGLILAVFLAIVSGGRFIFAAPGATYFFGNNVTRRQNGIISVAGPITNIIVGTILILLTAIITDNFIRLVLFQSGMINFWFALFNLLPINPLDGSKVITWKTEYWLALMLLSGILVFFPELIFGLIGI